MWMPLLLLFFSLPPPPLGRSVPAPVPALMGAEKAKVVCPVCGKTVPPLSGLKVTIRGREYAVDEKACGDELIANPDRYLDPEGNPKNAKRD